MGSRTMRRIQGIGQTVFGMSDSSTDGNRLYSILLDARASTASTSMYDVAERLVSSEKENAKCALEQLWTMKKNLQQDSDGGTIDMLIQYYQEKMDILRNREENIRKVSGDSRGLLEEKRKRDAEIANVKQEIGDCTSEIARLREKLEKLRVKEQELSLIDSQLSRELQTNANEVINGLYEIILSQQALGAGGEPGPQDEFNTGVAVESNEDAITADATADTTADTTVAGQERAVDKRDETFDSALDDAFVAPVREEQEDQKVHEDTEALVKLAESAPPPVYPKSVVKTTRGRVIGEYFYDGRVYKNKRHYVYNSRFFGEQLARAVKRLKTTSDGALHAETMQMVQDAHKRISAHANLHFETSTNEILNEKALQEALHYLRLRNYDETLKLSARILAKIKAMGSNYGALLKEQMDRYAQL